MGVGPVTGLGLMTLDMGLISCSSGPGPLAVRDGVWRERRWNKEMLQSHSGGHSLSGVCDYYLAWKYWILAGN